MDWGRAEFFYDWFAYCFDQLWLLWKQPQQAVAWSSEMVTPSASSRWLHTYLGHALDCDMPILEALWCAMEPKSLQAIWQELAHTYFANQPWEDFRPLFVMLEKDGWWRSKNGWSWNEKYDGGRGEWFAHRGPERRLSIQVYWYFDRMQWGWRYDIQWQEPGQHCKATSFKVIDAYSPNSTRNHLWMYLATYK